MLVLARDWRFESSPGHKSRESWLSCQLSYFIGILYNKTVSEGQLAQLVRASRLHREGQRFESSIAHRHGFARVDFSDIVDFVVSSEAGVAQW